MDRSSPKFIEIQQTLKLAANKKISYSEAVKMNQQNQQTIQKQLLIASKNEQERHATNVNNNISRRKYNNSSANLQEKSGPRIINNSAKNSETTSIENTKQNITISMEKFSTFFIKFVTILASVSDSSCILQDTIKLTAETFNIPIEKLKSLQ